jgi:hypothetical protein
MGKAKKKPMWVGIRKKLIKPEAIIKLILAAYKGES